MIQYDQLKVSNIYKIIQNNHGVPNMSLNSKKNEILIGIDMKIDFRGGDSKQKYSIINNI